MGYRHFYSWLFAPMEANPNDREIWKWWEKRRLAYNLILLAYSMLSFGIYAGLWSMPGMLRPGEDLLEPIALGAAVVGAPILWNLGYCLGPILHCGHPLGSEERRDAGPHLFRLGLFISFVALSLPALSGISSLFAR